VVCLGRLTIGERPAVPAGQNASYIASSGDLIAVRSSLKLLAELNQIEGLHVFVMYVLTVIALLNGMSV